MLVDRAPHPGRLLRVAPCAAHEGTWVRSIACETWPPLEPGWARLGCGNGSVPFGVLVARRHGWCPVKHLTTKEDPDMTTKSNRKWQFLSGGLVVLALAVAGCGGGGGSSSPSTSSTPRHRRPPRRHRNRVRRASPREPTRGTLTATTRAGPPTATATSRGGGPSRRARPDRARHFGRDRLRLFSGSALSCGGARPRRTRAVPAREPGRQTGG